MNKKEAEFAVLEVAFLITALDGTVDESERQMFDKLATECKNIDVDQAKMVLCHSDAAVKRLLAAYPKANTEVRDFMTQVSSMAFGKDVRGKTGRHGRFFSSVMTGLNEQQNKAFIRAFMEEVDQVCDWSDFVKSSERVRKAFAMWISMCLADGDYSEIERMGIAAIQKKLNGYLLVDDDYLASVEKTVSSIQAIEKKITKASNLETSRKLHERQDRDFRELTALIAD